MDQATVKREPVTWQQSIVSSHDDGEWVLHVGPPDLLSNQFIRFNEIMNELQNLLDVYYKVLIYNLYRTFY